LGDEIGISDPKISGYNILINNEIYLIMRAVYICMARGGPIILKLNLEI
jgi:hypothetical protein